MVRLYAPSDVRGSAADCDHILRRKLDQVLAWCLNQVVEPLPLAGLFVPRPGYRREQRRRAGLVKALHDANYVRVDI